MNKRLLLIDANAVIHRAFHALPLLTSQDGHLVNAVYGFSQILLKSLNDLKPDYVVCAFDSKKPTFRHQKYKQYKAKREKKGEELYGQFGLIKKVLKAFSIPIYEIEGYEADDIIATAAAKIKNLETIIVTGDLDTLALVNDRTKVLAMRRGISDTVLYDKKEVLMRFGFYPSSLADYKALAGDPSDNIPGVRGVGEKSAKDLIKNYGDIDSVYQNMTKHSEKIRRLLELSKKEAFLSKELILLKTDVPIKINLKTSEFGKFNFKKAAFLFYQLGFKSLLKRIPGYSKENLDLPILSKHNETKSDEIDHKVSLVLKEMEKTGAKIDKKHLEKISKEADSRILKLKNRIFKKTGGAFNLNSPRQLSSILFARLGLEIRGIKRTKTGVSTAEKELLKIKNSHPVIDLILDYRTLSKLKNAYLDTLPKMADINSRLHTTYTQDTQTGRIASKNPNLQNIPVKTELGNEIRKAFIADEGRVLIAADYSQIELRIMAHLSSDIKMISAFKQGLDIHQSVCDSMGVDRRTAKMINFGILYGISSFGLSEALGISPYVAENYINQFFKIYPKTKQYILDTVKRAKKEGYIETELGRRRYLPEINSPNIRVRKSAERMAINMPCQGLAADILKMAMVKLSDKLKAISNKQAAKLLLTVHDELVFEVLKENVFKAALVIKKVMENIFSLKVPLVVELSQGKNWGEMGKLKIKS